MEVLEFEVEIDGVVLPRWLFDPGSQVHLQTWLMFAGRVERCGEDDDVEPAFYAPGTEPFAALDGTQLCFVLVAGGGNSVFIRPWQMNVRIASTAASEAMDGDWWQLTWDELYTLSCPPDCHMTLRVRKIRPPMRDVMRSVLDSMNRGLETPPRAARTRGRENRA